MNKEHAEFAVKAIPDLDSFSNEIDAHDSKRINQIEASEFENLTTFLKKSNKTVAHHLLAKLKKGESYQGHFGWCHVFENGGA